MADNHTIARPYAQAVFDLAHEASELAAWSESLNAAAQLSGDGQIADYLSNPAFSNEQRLEFLTGLFASAKATVLAGGDKKGTNFLKLLSKTAVLPCWPR